MEDSNEEIEPCRSIGPHELVDSVKSQAVIKLSPVQVPAHFKRLELKTNLNLPPLNWLTTSESSHGLHQALYQSAGFASFRLGQMFPDCVGEVDVVSDAENIKQLLKLPYSAQGAISMVVHKVGNTLLLDEFDIQKYLLRKADDDWKWLRTFILEHILAYGDEQRNYCLKERSREALQRKNLLSKFLYHSLKPTDDDELDAQAATTSTQLTNRRTGLPLMGPVLPEPKIEENVPDPKSSHAFNRNVVWTFEDIRMLIGTDMPIFGGPNRPCISLRLRDAAQPINVLTGIDYWLDNLMCNVPEVVMCYHLDGIVQKYEIIKTEDLPYLENSQFSPQVVRNVAQNILAFLKANATKAGHTYWLFKGRNDDVVKLYDLTTLCQNQTAAAAAAGKTETTATTSSTTMPPQQQSNPFTVPVGMLLYSVARNMKNTAQHITPKTAGNIRALLSNCIKLLPKEQYPQIVTSSHYILSDLHVPAGIDPKSPNFDELHADTPSLYDDDDDDDDEEDEEEEEDEDEPLDGEYKDNLYYQSAAQSGGKANVAVRHICDALRDFKSHAKKAKPAPLIADIFERCNTSLQHISAGISCLQYFNGNEEERFIKESEAHAKEEELQRILHEEQNPNMAKPFNAIPLPYETLKTQGSPQLKLMHKQKKAKPKHSKSKELQQISGGTGATRNTQQLSAKFNNQHFGSWNVHLKLLLLEKACLTYATLAEHHYEAQRYGVTLRAIELACRCQQVLNKYMANVVSQQSCLLGRAGDCFFQMCKSWQCIDEYVTQYGQLDESACVIGAELTCELEEVKELATTLAPVDNVEQVMLLSCRCYEQALEHAQDAMSNELLRRLGNVRNELGLKYMYWAQEEYSEVMRAREANGASETPTSETEPLYVKLTVNCYDCLRRGIEAFTAVQDNVNLAFLYCNMGRFMRLRAHLIMPNESAIALDTQKTFYNEAFNYYEKAKDCLDTRKANAELWDLVHWELSTATFTLAKQLQDFSAAEKTNFADASKEVLELLQKSLQLCDVEHAGARQILYTFRSGLIHKRIASFHYSQLRANCNDAAQLSKMTLQLCKYHYEKATHILESLNEVGDLLVVQLERISLQEFLSELSMHSVQKIKHLQAALDICLQCQLIFSHVIETQSNAAETNANADGDVNVGSSTHTNVDDGEFRAHLTLYESRVQHTLKTLIKLLLTGKDPKQLSALYKQMYMETLTGKHGIGAQQETTAARAQHLHKLLVKLKAMCAGVATTATTTCAD